MFLLLRRSLVAGKQGACDVHEADDFFSHEGLRVCTENGVEVGGIATVNGTEHFLMDSTCWETR